MEKRKIDTIIFDMDGVIIDSEPINLNILQELYKEIGIEVSEELNLTSIGCASRKWWDFILEEFNITSRTSEEMSKKELNKVDEYTYKEETKKYIFDGVTENIKKLKEDGFKLALASASPYNIIDQVLKFADLENEFDFIISSTDKRVKKGKPDPDIFLLAAEELGSDPSRCLVVEDSERGLEAAKRANMNSLAFLSAPLPIKLDNADSSFDNYDDFMKNVIAFI